MNILIINATTHKSTGWHAAHFLTGAFMLPGDVLDEISCPVEGIDFCQIAECGATCLEEGEQTCPHWAALEPFLARFDAADLLVFDTPTYCYHAPAQVRVLIEHQCWRWMRHRPETSCFHTQAVVIGSAAGKGGKHSVGDIESHLKWLGIARIYTHSLVAGAMSWGDVESNRKQKLESDMKALAAKLSHDPACVTPSIGCKARFGLMRILQSKFPTSRIDHDTWERSGWLAGAKPWK